MTSSNSLLPIAAVVVVLLLASTTLVSAQNKYPSQKDVPVIGILVSPLEECIPPPAHIKKLNPNGCVESYYARWLEFSAARIIPIPFNATQARLDYLLARVNGVLFPGGGLDRGPVFDAYFKTLSYIVNYALDRNLQHNDPFVVKGTCYGFQMMGAAIAKSLGVVTGGFTGMYPLMMALNFTNYQADSRMFGSSTTPKQILVDLTTKASTLNWHHAGITPEDWNKNPYLNKILRPLSTNTEPSGQKSFVSSYEGIAANIYASQYHPERPPFEFTNPGIGHTKADIAVSQYISRFIVGRAKMNNHTFENPEDSEKLILEHHPRIYDGWGVETYYIV